MNEPAVDSNPADATRKALLAGLGAYWFWGLVPIYFKLVAAAGSDEIIAHRVVWSVGFLALVLALRNGRKVFTHIAISRKVALALLLSGALVAVNWLIFVYAVNSDRVLSTSLGYFINPLVSVVLGTVVLRERMFGAQVIAVLLAAAGTIYLTVQVGQPPWLALITVGLMQYLAPSISFCLAVFLFREPFTFDHAVAFGAIWSALALYTGASWKRSRQQRRIMANAAAASK